MKISKFKAACSLIFGGVEGLIEYLLSLFNELLKKADPTEMARYCGVVEAVTTCLKTIFGLFVDKLGENKTAALKATITALENLAKALKDNVFDKVELDQLIDDVKAAIEAWKAADKLHQPSSTIASVLCPLSIVLSLSLSVLLSGCKAFYENAGSRTVVGSVTSPIEISEPTSSCTVRALYAMDGADVYTAKDALVKIVYRNAYTNNYFAIVKTQGVQDLAVEIEPLDTSSTTNSTSTSNLNL